MARLKTKQPVSQSDSEQAESEEAESEPDEASKLWQEVEDDLTT